MFAYFGSSCVEVEPPSGEIPPGGTLRSVASLDTGRLRGQERKSILVETNDPLQPKIALAISCFVERQLQATPSAVTLERDSAGNWVSETIELIAEDRSVEFKILDFVFPTPEVTAEWHVLPAKNGYAVSITAAKSLGKKVVRSNLLLRTDYADEPEIPIRVLANL